VARTVDCITCKNASTAQDEEIDLVCAHVGTI
jgi:hypothetical protein